MARTRDYAHMSYCKSCKKNAEISISRSPIFWLLIIVVPIILAVYAVASVSVDALVLGAFVIFAFLLSRKRKRCATCGGSHLARPRAEAKVEAEI